MESGKNHRSELGRKGENIACKLLESMGHTILERNWRSGHLEIDIISFDASGIHFVEVKTRRNNIQAPPQENVNKKKQDRIVRAAQHFLRSGRGMPLGNHECMFDVVAITFCEEEYETEWIPQAFLPLYM